MALPPLVARIGADTSGLDAGLSRASDMLRRFAGPAAIGAAIVGLRGMISSAMETIDAQAKLARAVGGTTAGLQALARAGDRAGVQQSEMAAAATRLNQRLGQVISTGSGADATFRRLGLTAQQLARMDVDQRFAAIGDAMRRAGMSSQEMSFHLRELGIRQASVITLIQSGSDEITRSRRVIEELGVAIEDIDAQSVERANDALSEVGRVFEGLRNLMAVRVAPAIEMVANAFVGMAREGGILNRVIRGFVEILPSILTYLGTAAAAAAAYTAAIVAMAAAKGAAALAAAGLRVALIRLGIPALVIGAGFLVDQFRLLVRGAGGFGEALDELGKLAREVWNGIVTMAQGIVPSLQALWTRIQANFATMAGNILTTWSATLLAMSEDLPRLPGMGLVQQGLQRASLAAMGAASDLSGTIAQLNARAQQFADQGGAAMRDGAAQIGGAFTNLLGVMNRVNDGLAGDAPSTPAGGGEGEGAGGGGAGAGAGNLREALQRRFEMVRDALATESEALQQWYSENLKTLEEARAQELLKEDEYHRMREALEREHQNRLRDIRKRGDDQAISDTIRAGQQILTSVAGNNQRLLGLARTFGAADALIKAYQGAAAALADPNVSAWGRIAAAAKVLAAGIGFVTSIAGVGRGGGGGGAATGGGTVATSAAAATQTAAMPTQTLRFDFGGAASMGMEQLVELLNDAYDRGFRIRAVMA
jgi:hypothetical protein